MHIFMDTTAQSAEKVKEVINTKKAFENHSFFREKKANKYAIKKGFEDYITTLSTSSF